MTTRWIDPVTGRGWGSVPPGYVHPKSDLRAASSLSDTEASQ